MGSVIAETDSAAVPVLETVKVFVSLAPTSTLPNASLPPLAIGVPPSASDITGAVTAPLRSTT